MFLNSTKMNWEKQHRFQKKLDFKILDTSESKVGFIIGRLYSLSSTPPNALTNKMIYRLINVMVSLLLILILSSSSTLSFIIPSSSTISPHLSSPSYRLTREIYTKEKHQIRYIHTSRSIFSASSSSVLWTQKIQYTTWTYLPTVKKKSATIFW